MNDLDQKAYEGQFCTCNIARQFAETEKAKLAADAARVAEAEAEKV